MSQERPLLTAKEQSVLYILSVEGVRNAVKGLSQMIGEELDMQEPFFSLVPVVDLPNLLGAETEAAAVFVTTHGELEGQFLLMLPYENALEMVDLLMLQPTGTTTGLDPMGKSALAEAGNLTGAYFLNKIVEITNLTTVPSAPTVLVDLVGAILSVVVSSTIEHYDQVMVVRALIQHHEKHVQANFWFIPNPQTVASFAEKAMKLLD
jgi:chemotaxis protein CheC